MNTNNKTNKSDFARYERAREAYDASERQIDSRALAKAAAAVLAIAYKRSTPFFECPHLETAYISLMKASKNLAIYK